MERKKELHLGVRAHDVGRFTADELARKVSDHGFESVHLALHKAIVGFDAVPGAVNEISATAVGDACAAQGVGIAILGCYINPVHPDVKARQAGSDRFVEHLRHAPAFQCNIVATETGSIAPDCSYHQETARPGTYSTFCKTIERWLEVAESAPAGVVVGIEPVAGVHTIDSRGKMHQLLSDMGSSRLKVVYDPVNLFPIEGEIVVRDEVSHCLDAFGEHVCAFHLKDYIIEAGRKKGDLGCGAGLCDYRALFQAVHGYGAGLDDLPFLVESGTPETFGQIIQLLQDAWK